MMKNMNQMNTSKNKKNPLRKCVGCSQSKDKKEFIRIIKTKDEQVLVDITGRANGRGAYICKDVACLKKAHKSKGLERSLKIAIPDDVYEILEKEMNDIAR